MFGYFVSMILRLSPIKQKELDFLHWIDVMSLVIVSAFKWSSVKMHYNFKIYIQLFKNVKRLIFVNLLNLSQLWKIPIIFFLSIWIHRHVLFLNIFASFFWSHILFRRTCCEPRPRHLSIYFNCKKDFEPSISNRVYFI